LISLLKTQYGEEIKDVRITHKLKDTPACLSVGEGDMDFRMERFLMEHKQLPKRAAKILEINPEHPLIALLADTVTSKGASDDIADAAQLLLDQAKIIEGETIADASAFARRLSYFMQRAMAA
jgi:molecular chaperone HtpG